LGHIPVGFDSFGSLVQSVFY